MTNRQHEEDDLIFSIDPSIHDKHTKLSAHDLHLTPEQPHEKRDKIDVPQPDAPELLLSPPPRHRHHGAEQKPKKRRTKKQILLLILLIFLGVIVGIGLIAGITYAILYNIGKKELLPSSDVVLSAPDSLVADPDIEVEVKDDGRTVRYNGKTYRFNENRTNILCIGMDKTKTGEEALIGLRGQADTLVLVSIDMKTGQVDAIPISRNTIVGIRQYDPDGNFAGMKNTQICLAYGFGKDDAASCENVVDAVSRLFYGLPINTYFCMDLSAIAILNDAVGGVTVTTPCEVPFDAEHPLPAGSTIHLNGKQARLFVQYRDTSKIDSNQERMKRQECYLTAFFQAAMAATKEDIQVPIRLYNAVSANSTTTLNPSRITALATTLVSKNAQLQFHSLNGENTEIVQGDDGYVEYHPDDIAMYETFLKVFYTPVS